MGIISYDVKKSFGEKEVIKNFSFEVETGKVTVLIGKNGCGKTTWIKTALDLYSKDEGTITYDGAKFDDVRMYTSVVFDEIPIAKNLSGYDNLEILSGGLMLKDKEVILDSLGLEKKLMKMKGKSFSFGQRHKLAVAAALIRKPRYLFLDEPSVGLDLESWDKVSKMIREAASDGCCVLVTGHNYDLIEEIADNVVIIKDGLIFFSGSMDSLVQSNKNLKETYREIFMKDEVV